MFANQCVHKIASAPTYLEVVHIHDKAVGTGQTSL